MKVAIFILFLALVIWQFFLREEEPETIVSEPQTYTPPVNAPFQQPPSGTTQVAPQGENGAPEEVNVTPQTEIPLPQDVASEAAPQGAKDEPPKTDPGSLMPTDTGSPGMKPPGGSDKGSPGSEAVPTTQTDKAS